jgi:hypothetical protein
MHTEGSLSLSWSEVTCTGRGYPDKLMGGPPSSQGCFRRCAPVEDPIYRRTVSQCGEGAIHRGDRRGRVAPRCTSPSLEDTDLEEASVPHLFTVVQWHTDLSPPTPTSPHWRRASPPTLRHPWVGRQTAAIPKTLCKIASVLKR